MYVYRYDAMRELLERHRDYAENPHEGLLIEYIDPLTGGPVYKTMTFFMQMVRKGETTLPIKQSASLLVAPFEGKGYSLVDDRRFDWKAFDTLAIPGGSWYEHVNGSDKENVFLFIASDEPTLKKLDLYKKWGRTRDDAIVRLV